MQAAEHGADFPMAKKVRESMSHDQMHDFSVGSMFGKPEHVEKPLLQGSSSSIMGANTNSLKQAGQSEFDATRQAIQLAGAKHPNRHKNLGKFLHPKKDK